MTTTTKEPKPAKPTKPAKLTYATMTSRQRTAHDLKQDLSKLLTARRNMVKSAKPTLDSLRLKRIIDSTAAYHIRVCNLNLSLKAIADADHAILRASKERVKHLEHIIAELGLAITATCEENTEGYEFKAAVRGSGYDLE